MLKAWSLRKSGLVLMVAVVLLLGLPVWASPNHLILAPVEVSSGSLPDSNAQGTEAANKISFCYSISQPAKVTLKIYGEQGKVTTLLSEVPRARGYNCEAWGGRDNDGVILAPGTYRYLIAAQVSELTETASGKATFTQVPFAVGSFWTGALDEVSPTLKNYYNTSLISKGEFEQYLANWQKAALLLERLSQKERIREYRDLSSVLGTVLRLNRDGELSPDRAKILLGKVVPVNAEFFSRSPAPEYSYTKIPASQSNLTFVYYANQGIQLQPVTTLLRALEADDEDFLKTMEELLPLFADRFHQGQNFAVLEYYFAWEGQDGPWISSMSQGLALETLARAYKLTGDSRYLRLGDKILESFYVPWNQGGLRSIDQDEGWWYLEFSYNDKPRVLNGFLYSLLGLQAYRDLTGDKKAEELLERGLLEAERHIADYDLPLGDGSDAGWSKYSLEHGAATVDYHLTHLVLLSKLNEKTASPVFAEYQERWQEGLRAGPPD